ncbi:MAG: amino acid ABC transporter permease [Burkholderiaceae bacterium]|jgi:His/Glu/Gln/Arg/opine family amino acid ABC transporter permease subunit|nr:amino acid ABC transporter permease [Burkholderiaceae bacterium]
MDVIQVFGEAFPMLLRGLGITVQITVASLIMAVVLGLASCLMGLSRIAALRWLSKGYVWLIRGTPLLVQVFFVYFGFPQLIQAIGHSVGGADAGNLSDLIGGVLANFRISAFMASFVTLSLNAGAYMSEIFRGGIQAVNPGQMEAARSLGMSHSRAMYRVILPQALRICVPSLVNQFIITLKDTSIVSIISLQEIVYNARIYIGRTMLSFGTWIIVGAMYLLVITVLSFLSKYLERRLDHGQRS